jgi:light-regulated signal transduction histidine kinase (bacteriophytochrome)
MGVGASLSASIICHDELWGMLVLHHYSSRHVPADLRVACETFAQALSLHVVAKVETETARKRADKRRESDLIVAHLAHATDIGSVLSATDLASYLGAIGAAVFLDGTLHRVGETPTAAQIRDLVEWLNALRRPLFSTERLADHYAPAAAFSANASGLVAIGLSRAPRVSPIGIMEPGMIGIMEPRKVA